MTQDQKTAAVEVFTNYPTAKEVFITPDNQAFLKSHRAAMHHKEYATILRSDVMPEEKSEDNETKLTAKELIEKVATMDSLDELEALLKDEARSTVIAAIEKRKTELNPAL